MKFLPLPALALGLLSVYCAPSLAAERFVIELATPPVWFFRDHWPPFGGTATCTAVNLHDKPITLTTQLIIHDDDGFPFPILDPPIELLKQGIEPGQATELTLEVGSQSLDAHLARCVFKYKGNSNKVKATIILDDSRGQRTITAPAEPTSKVLLTPPVPVED